MSPTQHLRMASVPLHMQDEVATTMIQAARGHSTDGVFGWLCAMAVNLNWHSNLYPTPSALFTCGHTMSFQYANSLLPWSVNKRDFFLKRKTSPASVARQPSHGPRSLTSSTAVQHSMPQHMRPNAWLLKVLCDILNDPRERRQCLGEKRWWRVCFLLIFVSALSWGQIDLWLKVTVTIVALPIHLWSWFNSITYVLALSVFVAVLLEPAHPSCNGKWSMLGSEDTCMLSQLQFYEPHLNHVPWSHLRLWWPCYPCLTLHWFPWSRRYSAMVLFSISPNFTWPSSATMKSMQG